MIANLALCCQIFSQFPGTADFMFTMEELKEANNGVEVSDHEIYVEAEVFDWFTRNQGKGSALTVVYSNDVELLLLGDVSRTFKPNQTMDVYVRIIHIQRQQAHCSISYVGYINSKWIFV